MNTILQELRDAAQKADAPARRSLLSQLQALQLELEQPEDTIKRVMFLNCQMAVVSIGINLKVFNCLVESKIPLDVTRIAKETGADPVLVGRILRYLACTGYIKEESQDVFSATHITTCLANSDTQAGVSHYFDFLGPIYQMLPEYLAENKYRNITNSAKTPLHHAYKTDLMPWDWFQTQPEKAMAFSTWAAARERGAPAWIPTSYPFAARASATSFPAEAPLFVDVGGGFGQQAALVRDLFPSIAGAVIVEDYPAVLSQAQFRENVQKFPHDFFQPQPPAARGARFYYLRQVLHDHSDERAKLVLANLRDAMAEESVLLVDEIVVPDTGADWMSVHMDLVVMAGLAGTQRTRAHWERLVEEVGGLRVRDVFGYNPETADAVLEIVRDG